jgi:hypothetical protein
LEEVYKSGLYKVAFVMLICSTYMWGNQLKQEPTRLEPWMTKNEMEPKETKQEQTEMGRTGRLSQGKPWEPLHRQVNFPREIWR